ncbi:Flp pilus assembly protein CpaB [Methylophaga sp. OBS4]|uniref:Flp pilus assembly protein CpaB n=1 Tax=Methylophaga sp. OBS4 TaxID=2991935 RepID=UPI002250A78E|nr:Flp pilus assembly protein CpaB [Methylophaga sp. OBS4]MCX4187520.1 Flp pilus assembly protein CpaB [Methylophaga sp. OBS4]
MSSSTLRMVAILLALGAAVLGYLGYQAGRTPAAAVAPVSATVQQEPERVAVLIAARDIDAGKTIGQDDVTTQFVSKAVIGVYQQSGDVIGREPRMTIAAGEVLIEDHFHNDSPLVQSIRPGERAVAVRVDEVIGTGGFIQPGDIVDVLFYLQAGRETGKNSSAQLLLPDIRVLAFGNTVDMLDRDAIRKKSRAHLAKAEEGKTLLPEGSKAPDQDDPTGKKSKTAVLAVARDAVSKLLLAESSGRIRLALHGADSPAKQPDNPAFLPATAAKSQGNPHYLVTLKTLTATPVVPSQTTARRVAAPAAKPKVLVHRGSAATAVTVEQEN